MTGLPTCPLPTPGSRALQCPRTRRITHWVSALIAAGIFVVGCNLHSRAGAKTEEPGTVRFDPVEGGCWTIEVNGQRVEPVNLPDEFKQDGLEVSVQLEEEVGVSACQVGPLRKVTSIRKR